MNQQVSKNKVVQFTYTIVDETGNVIEQIDKPVQYIHGTNSAGLVKTVENVMEGANVGDTVEAEVPPSESFGDHDPELILIEDIKNVPPQFQVVGTEVEMTNDKGENKPFVITKIEDNKVTIDGNHPLAGKTTRFIVSIVGIRDATIEEITTGVISGSVAMH